MMTQLRKEKEGAQRQSQALGNETSWGSLKCLTTSPPWSSKILKIWGISKFSIHFNPAFAYHMR